MSWITQLFVEPTVAHSILIISLVIAVGLLLARIRIAGVSFGVAWILFAGLFVGQIGIELDGETAHFVKEFGLILFIFSIGVEVGPGFFDAFRKGGVLLNALGFVLVLLGSLIAVGIGLLSGTDMMSMVGVLSGAVTNTPGLGAAQQAYLELHSGEVNPVFAQGYAVAYPFGVVGIILSIAILKRLFCRDIEAESRLYAANSGRNGYDLQQRMAESRSLQEPHRDEPRLFFIFLGIALGVFLGLMPIPVPGMSVPLRLGLAGGPLVVAIIFSHFGPSLHLDTRMTRSANLWMRQLGISLFLASVGVGAGKGFLEMVAQQGVEWMLFGIVITVVPCLVVGLIARYVFRLSFFSIAGMIGGATTDPPALAYANVLCADSRVNIAYTTVYPLAMFLRVFVAEVIVVLFG